MKTKTMQLVSTPAFELKPTIKGALTFIVDALLIFLFASIGKLGFALALAMFCGLVYARQNILALAPCFIVAVCVFSLEWLTLALAAAPVVVLLLLYSIFFKLKKNVPLWIVALCGIIGISPFVIYKCVVLGDFLYAGVSAIVVLVGIFCCGIIFYAILVRGISHKLTADETICGGVVLSVCGYALSRVGGYGFFAYDLALAFAVLFCSCCFKAHTTLFVSIIFGIGATVYSGNISTLSCAVLIGAGAVVFSPFTKWASAISVVAVQSLFYVLNVYVGVAWQSIVMVAVGVLIALVIPKSALSRLQSLTSNDGRHAYSGIVNRRGRELATRLYSASDVFFDMSKNLESIANEKGDFSPRKLAKDVAKNYCAKCRDRESCFSALGQDTSGILLPMADAAINRGKVTILDMPPFITGRCANMHSLANVINSTANAYKQRQDMLDSVCVCKSMMAQQFAGVSLVLDSIAQSCAEQVNFSSDDVDLLRNDLLKHNIVANEIVVSGEKCDMGVVLLVRDCDAQKSILPRVVSKCLKRKFEIVSVGERGDQKIVHLKSAPVFEVAYGTAQKSFDENEICGDSKSILCPSRTSRLFAICDGMGHGNSASVASQNALKMIESFYRAGIDSNIILNLVNKLLKISLDDTFSTLDIAVIDTQTGALDVIKLGASNSFIIRRDNIEVLSCTNAPAGILENVESASSRYQLFDGDMLVMMSDGVFDMLENKGVADAVDNANTQNPQVLADELMRRATANGACDDCTVMVLRLFAT